MGTTMMSFGKFVLLFLLYFGHGVLCLKVTELLILPNRIVERGSRVTLRCIYELDTAPLYCVKWYRGRHEFYRFTPEERPSTKIFPFTGINVDLASSNATQVVLQRVDFALSGNFSCEVSADAPLFSTAIISQHMEVVSIPQGVPVIVAENSHFEPGELLRANCTAPPSRPKANISFFINNQQITPGQIRQRDVDKGLYQVSLSITMLLLPGHFEGGGAILKCVADIAHMYGQEAELHLRSSRAGPRIERVTSNRSSVRCSGLQSLMSWALLLPLLLKLKLKLKDR